jgi:hypothetical protein
LTAGKALDYEGIGVTNGFTTDYRVAEVGPVTIRVAKSSVVRPNRRTASDYTLQQQRLPNRETKHTSDSAFGNTPNYASISRTDSHLFLFDSLPVSSLYVSVPSYDSDH